MRRFVFCSSISVYGDVGAATITESTPLRPTSVYGATKVACEQLIQGFAVEYGLEGVSLRIGRVYGPYRRANCYFGAMIRDAAAGASPKSRAIRNSSIITSMSTTSPKRSLQRSRPRRCRPANITSGRARR